MSKLYIAVLAITTGFLIGCASGRWDDTNGYYSKHTGTQVKYCQVARGKTIAFVPCNEVKHDVEI